MNNMTQAAIKSELNMQLGIDPREILFADEYAFAELGKFDVFVYKEPKGFKVSALDNDNRTKTTTTKEKQPCN